MTRENTHENPASNQESDITWSAAAKRFKGKINAEIDTLEDNHPRVILLNRLESLINVLFLGYENKNFNIKQVESDIDSRMKGDLNEEDKLIYQQIKLFINGTFTFII